jgi:hypothetical protein
MRRPGHFERRGRDLERDPALGSLPFADGTKGVDLTARQPLKRLHDATYQGEVYMVENNF